MSKPIRHALERALALIFALLLPATGRRRRRGRPRPAHSAPRTPSGLRLFVHRAAVPALAEVLTQRAKSRSGRRSDDSVPLDDTGPLVRPYLLAHERRQRQAERRAALVLALDGIDIGPWVIHGHRIGTPAVSSLGVAA
ncbi:hypothetical protein [Streptomyces sp. NPDC093991]|jgi:hypothetical protein|uniref:hypothetical protein n=1 Tax=unclassified Streptomyces TaxID=2593676 RepID=UPI0034298259